MVRHLNACQPRSNETGRQSYREWMCWWVMQDWRYGAVLWWWRPSTRQISVWRTATAAVTPTRQDDVGRVSDCTTAVSSDSACVDHDIRRLSTATVNVSTVRVISSFIGIPSITAYLLLSSPFSGSQHLFSHPFHSFLTFLFNFLSI